MKGNGLIGPDSSPSPNKRNPTTGIESVTSLPDLIKLDHNLATNVITVGTSTHTFSVFPFALNIVPQIIYQTSPCSPQVKIKHMRRARKEGRKKKTKARPRK